MMEFNMDTINDWLGETEEEKEEEKPEEEKLFIPVHEPGECKA
jgi:hypothetical protein